MSLVNITFSIRSTRGSKVVYKQESGSSGEGRTVAPFVILKSGIRRPAVHRICQVCDRPFLARRDAVRAGKGTVCSVRCAAEKAHRRAPLPPRNVWGHSRRDGRKHPAVIRAHARVHDAVKRRLLVRPVLCVCGASPVEAHHEDYTQPLVVAWLCRSCHLKRHYLMGRLGIQPLGAVWATEQESATA